MFITRTISGAVLILVIFSAMIFGGPVWLVLTGLLSVIALFELYRVFGLHKTPGAIIGYIADAALYTVLWFDARFILLVIMAYFIIIMALYVISWPKLNVSDISRYIFSFIYAGLCMSFLYTLNAMDNGLYFMWLIFIAAWVSDTFAYCVGMLIGKHKLPSSLRSLSPKKSIEGCIGGIVGAALVGFFYGMWVDANVSILPGISCMLVFAIAGGIGSVVSQIGDLCASAVKRNCDIKDYGKLIPGHGGIMDRFDSIIFVAPIIYYIVYLIA